jgi:hypothetical protein
MKACKLILLSIVLTMFIFLMPAQAVTVCHDYTRYRVSVNLRCPVENTNGLGVGDLRTWLGRQGFTGYNYSYAVQNPRDAQRYLQPGDVLILGEAHSGIVNAYGGIDNYLQVEGMIGQPHDPRQLPHAVRGRLGGLYLNDSLQYFLWGHYARPVAAPQVQLWRRTSPAAANCANNSGHDTGGAFDLSGPWTFYWNWSVTGVNFIGNVSGGGGQWAFKGTLESGGNAIWRPGKGTGTASCTLTTTSGANARIRCAATFQEGKYEDGRWKPVSWVGEADGVIEARSNGGKRQFVFRGRGSGSADGGAKAGIDHLDLSPKQQ